MGSPHSNTSFGSRCTTRRVSGLHFPFILRKENISTYYAACGAQTSGTRSGEAGPARPCQHHQDMMLFVVSLPVFAPRHSRRACPCRAARATASASEVEWRNLRARLVQGEQQNQGEATSSSFVYESPLIEVGSLLLDTEMERRTEVFGYPTMRPAEQAFFHKAVVLVVERNADGCTCGVILNRPSALRLDGWRLWFGGPCGTGAPLPLTRPVHQPTALLPALGTQAGSSVSSTRWARTEGS